jgi:hypothetical protein
MRKGKDQARALVELDAEARRVTAVVRTKDARGEAVRERLRLRD